MFENRYAITLRKQGNIFRRLLPATILLLFSCHLWADINLATTQEGFDPEGSCERLGQVGFLVNGDDFADASPQNPIYIRVRLESNVTLCTAHVPPQGTATEPVYLAVSLLRNVPEGGGAGIGVDIPTDAVSIIRWQSDEDAFWVRVTDSSSDWVVTGSGQEAPSAANPVIFTLGIDAQTSIDANQPLFQAGAANLPFNTRNPAATNPSEAVDTLLEADMTENTLSPVQGLEIDPVALSDSTGVTNPDPFQIQTGNIVPINFLGNTIVGLPQSGGTGGGPIDGVIVDTDPTEIYFQGECEIAGSLSMILMSDEFAEAGPDSPIFIRIRMSSDAVLASTRVDVGGDPIYLALSLNVNAPGPVLAADPQSISIIRWKTGEPDIWLKVTSSSSQWINDGAPSAPSEENRVSFTLGVDAQTSWDANKPLFDSDLANLPSNTATPSGLTLQDATDTTYKIDVSESTLSPAADGVFIDPIAFAESEGVQTEPDPQNINPGLIMPINFMIREIAIAYGIDVEINPPVAVQGPNPVIFEAITEPGVTIQSYEWTNAGTGQVIGMDSTILFDPIPTETTVIQLRVVDDEGAVGLSSSVLLVNPIGVDPDGDGQATMGDLYIMLPQWNTPDLNVMDLLLINVGL